MDQGWSSRTTTTKKKDRNPTYTWKLKNALFNDNLVKEELKKEVKDF